MGLQEVQSERAVLWNSCEKEWSYSVVALTDSKGDFYNAACSPYHFLEFHSACGMTSSLSVVVWPDPKRPGRRRIAGPKSPLYEMRPKETTQAHKTGGLAELVCSNSLGSVDPLSAPGILKEEMRRLNSLIIRVGRCMSKVPAGSALGRRSGPVLVQDYSGARKSPEYSHPSRGNHGDSGRLPLHRGDRTL